MCLLEPSVTHTLCVSHVHQHGDITGCEFSTGPGTNASGNLVGPVKILV